MRVQSLKIFIIEMLFLVKICLEDSFIQYRLFLLTISLTRNKENGIGTTGFIVSKSDLLPFAEPIKLLFPKISRYVQESKYGMFIVRQW